MKRRERITAYLDLCDCIVRVLAATVTSNDVAAWNVFCDAEDAHRRLGHSYNQLSKDRPWEFPDDDA